MYIRLFLIPIVSELTQRIIDVDYDSLVLSNEEFVPVQTAISVTLVEQSQEFKFTPFNLEQQKLNLVSVPTQEVKVCWREPVSEQEHSNDFLITTPDPTNGICVCGITCKGTRISFAKVQNKVPI